MQDHRGLTLKRAQKSVTSPHPGNELLCSRIGESRLSGMDQPRSKPAPDVYLAAAVALGIHPADALVVEDTVSGVTAGVAAGATVIGVSTGGPASTSPGELLAAGAVRVCGSMSEVAELIAECEPLRS